MLLAVTHLDLIGLRLLEAACFCDLAPLAVGFHRLVPARSRDHLHHHVVLQGRLGHVAAGKSLDPVYLLGITADTNNDSYKTTALGHELVEM